MTTLTIIYFSFMTGAWNVAHHRVDTERCQAIYQAMRRQVRVGRIWGVCHP